MISPKELPETLTLVETAEKLAYQYIAIQKDPHRRNQDFHIPNELSEKFIKWLLDAYNSDMLKAWHKGDYKFEATRNIAKEIEIKAPDLKAYLERTFNLVYTSKEVPFTKKDIERLKVNIKDASHGEGFSAVFSDYEMWPTFIKDAVIELQAKLLKKKQVTSKAKEIPLSNELPKEITLNNIVFWIFGKRLDDFDTDCTFDTKLARVLINRIPATDNEKMDDLIILQERENSTSTHEQDLDFSPRNYYYLCFNLYGQGKKISNNKFNVIRIIEKAKCRGIEKIHPEILALILTYDCSVDILKNLVETYLCNDFGQLVSKGNDLNNFDFAVPENRISFWFDLICVWTGWDNLKKLEDEKKLKTTNDGQIELKSLYSYLTDLGVPLPARLFPREMETEASLPIVELDKPDDITVKKVKLVEEGKGYLWFVGGKSILEGKKSRIRYGFISTLYKHIGFGWVKHDVFMTKFNWQDFVQYHGRSGETGKMGKLISEMKKKLGVDILYDKKEGVRFPDYVVKSD